MSNLSSRLERIHDRLHESLQRQRRDLNESRNDLQGRVVEAERGLAELRDDQQNALMESRLMELTQTDQQQQERLEGVRSELIRLTSDAETRLLDYRVQLQEDVGRLKTEISSDVSFISAEVETVHKEIAALTNCPWRVEIDSIWDSFGNVGSLVEKLESRIDELSGSLAALGKAVTPSPPRKLSAS